MKPRLSNQRTQALTLVEVLLVIVVVVVLAIVFLPAIHHHPIGAPRIYCLNNLKQIGLAYRIWEVDHGYKYPMEVAVTNGGAMELIAAGNVAACFQVMSNELCTPRILVCPADTKRIAATNFTTDFNNSKISYFVGLDAADTQPQTLLSGDDNFAVDDVPVKSGLLQIITNSPITWTGARHKFAGNIGFADGSVQQVSSKVGQINTKGLQTVFQETGVATNRLAIP